VTDLHHLPNQALQKEYLHVFLDAVMETNPEEGLRFWGESFQTALDAWDEKECRRLLREIKKSPQTAAVKSFSDYAQGRLTEKQGYLPDAIQWFQASLDGTSAFSSQRGYVLNDLGLAYLSLGNLEYGKENFIEALEIFRVKEETESLASTLIHLATLYTLQGKVEKAENCLEEGLSLSQQPETIANTHIAKGILLQTQSKLESAKQSFNQALHIFLERNEETQAALVYNNLGLLALDQHNVKDAYTLFTDALSITQSLNDWAGTVRTLGNLALAAEMECDYAKAISYSSEAIESAKELNDKRALATFLNIRGYLYIDLNELNLAIKDLEFSIKIAQKSGNPVAEMTALNNLGTALRHTGKFKKAVRCYEKSLMLSKELSDEKQKGEVLGNLGNLYLDLNDNFQAKEKYEAALKIAKKTKNPSSEGACLIGLSAIALEQREYEKLLTLNDQTFSLGTETNQPDLLVRASWIYGDMAMLAKDTLKCYSHYARAIVFAIDAGEMLLDATLERIGIYLDGISNQERLIIYNTILRIWKKHPSFEQNKKINTWLKNTFDNKESHLPGSS
jgi:tetratricopeptide (TPR) repeat protein